MYAIARPVRGQIALRNMSGILGILLICASNAPLQATGAPGHALQFDGLNDRVRIPFSDSLGFTTEFTLEAWIRPTSSAGGIAGMWGHGGLPDRLLLFLQGGSVRVNLARDGVPGIVELVAPVPQGQWTHVAVTFDGALLSLITNGAAVVSTNAPGSLPMVAQDFRMGVEDRFVGPAPAYFAGLIDEMRLWSIVRSLSDIATSYNRTVPATSPGLVAYWNFDEPLASQLVLDASPQGNQGTLGASAATGVDDPQRVPSTAPIGGAAGLEFLRGDCDLSGSVNLGDAVLILSYLFPAQVPGPMLVCPNACDANDSETLSLLDALAMLTTLFGQPPTFLPPPYPACGPDPTPSTALGCTGAPPCL